MAQNLGSTLYRWWTTRKHAHSRVFRLNHPEPGLKDNGGFLVVILTLLVTAIVLRSPNIGEKQLVWSILISLTLVIDSIFHIYKLIISRANAGGVIGSPVIQIGLVMVFIGSILLLLSTSVKYLKPLL